MFDVLDAQVDGLAAELQAVVAHEGAGQEAGLAQDLEAVAATEHQPAGLGVARHRLHHRREAGDGAAAQIVAVGEAARQHDAVVLREVPLAMPDIVDLLPKDRVQDVVAVPITPRAGEHNYSEAHRQPFVVLGTASLIIHESDRLP